MPAYTGNGVKWPKFVNPVYDFLLASMHIYHIFLIILILNTFMVLCRPLKFRSYLMLIWQNMNLCHLVAFNHFMPAGLRYGLNRGINQEWHKMPTLQSGLNSKVFSKKISRATPSFWKNLKSRNGLKFTTSNHLDNRCLFHAWDHWWT